jgi:hypothetical protein
MKWNILFIYPLNYNFHLITTIFRLNPTINIKYLKMLTAIAIDDEPMALEVVKVARCQGSLSWYWKPTFTRCHQSVGIPEREPGGPDFFGYQNAGYFGYGTGNADSQRNSWSYLPLPIPNMP